MTYAGYSTGYSVGTPDAVAKERLCYFVSAKAGSFLAPSVQKEKLEIYQAFIAFTSDCR